MRNVEPYREKHRALQQELLPVRGHRQPVQHPLYREAIQYELEVFVALPCAVTQPLPYGADAV
ncbi:hypothetical protein D3C80_2205720 [compost metagenome]